MKGLSSRHTDEGYKLLTELYYDCMSDFVLLERADLSKNAMMYEDAIRVYEKVLEYNPGYQYGYVHLGYIYKNMCKYEDAMVNLRKAIYYEGDNVIPYPYRNLARVCERLGLDEEARERYEELSGKIEGQDKFYVTVADIIRTSLKLGDIDKALEMADKHRYNKEWAANDAEYFMERYDAYVSVKDFDASKKELDYMEAVLAELSGNELDKWRCETIVRKSKYEQMSKCTICVTCLCCTCVEQNIAEGMLLEKKGDIEAAIRVHKESDKKCPIDCDSYERYSILKNIGDEHIFIE